MASRRSEEFRAEAVRVALTSGLPRKQVARNFGIGFSTLSRWIQQDRRNPEKPAAQSDLEREIVELRKENRLLREGEEDQERPQWGVSPTNDVLKKATVFFAERSK
jgi:transposase